MSFSAPSGPNAHNYKFTSRCLFETPKKGKQVEKSSSSSSSSEDEEEDEDDDDDEDSSEDDQSFSSTSDLDEESIKLINKVEKMIQRLNMLMRLL